MQVIYTRIESVSKIPVKLSKTTILLSVNHDNLSWMRIVFLSLLRTRLDFFPVCIWWVILCQHNLRTRYNLIYLNLNIILIRHKDLGAHKIQRSLFKIYICHPSKMSRKTTSLITKYVGKRSSDIQIVPTNLIKPLKCVQCCRNNFVHERSCVGLRLFGSYVWPCL